MKKLFAVGATAALMLAASSPAFAHGFNDDGVIINDSGNTDVQFVDASQFQFALQGQFGDANAIGDDNIAVVASDQSITQNQANAGLGEISDLNQGGDDVGDFFFVD